MCAFKAEDAKERVCAAVDECGGEILDVCEDILEHPELGFKETWTAARVEQALHRMGVDYRNKLAVTGVKAWLETGRSGPAIALLGEMDSVFVPEHPCADPGTGAAHACGHPMQLAAMLGAGMGIVRSGVLGDLSGRIALFAVPAEEYVEIEYRLGLVRRGSLEFLSGKAELARLGEFDDIDMAMMVHAISDPDHRLVSLNASTNGMVAKRVQFVGRASHAGAAPWDGVNALNAAHVAMAALHAQRETFKDSDSIRVHPIITRGGALVNVVPDDVRMETFVRGTNMKAVADASTKVDRALRAGAMALGAQVLIETMPGYLPLREDPTLVGLFKDNMLRFTPPTEIVEGLRLTSSTDMGDITHIMPGLHAHIGGAAGTLHGSDFVLTDLNHLCLNTAKSLAMTVVDLLADEAILARQLLGSFRPLLGRAEYLQCLRSLSSREHFDGSTAPVSSRSVGSECFNRP